MVAQLQAGQEIDRYKVEWVLGEGGMASVFRVRHVTLGTTHALKVLSITTTDIRQRLIQEGQMQATLQHPNIVSVSDVIDIQGVPGLLMEYIEGPSIDQWTYRYRPTLPEALAVFRGIVEGVGHAHNNGLIHRDIKPGNILLHVGRESIIPKVTDFGLAKFAQMPSSPKRTQPGTTMGTPQYMAPEQMRDASKVDHRADLFSLGCILYELVCGTPPFEGNDLVELINTVCKGDYVPISQRVPNVPAEVIATVKDLLNPDVMKRIDSCEEILARLQPKRSWVQINDAGGLMDHAMDTLMDGGANALELDGAAAKAISRLVVENRDKTLPADQSQGTWTDSLDDLEPAKQQSAQSSVAEQRFSRRMVWSVTMVLAAIAALLGAALATFAVAALWVSIQDEAKLVLAEEHSILKTSAEQGAEIAAPIANTPAQLPVEKAAPMEKSEATTQASAPIPVPEEVAIVKPSVKEVVVSLVAPAPPLVVERAPVPEVVPEVVSEIVPEVVPEPAPAVSAPRPPEPSVKPLTFQYKGAESVILLSKSDVRYEAGELLKPGNYQVWARFPGTAEIHAGQVIALAGEGISLRCVDALLQCRTR